MYQPVCVEKLLPAPAPPFFVVPAKGHYPVHGIMRLNSAGPGPDHIGMKNRDKKVYILRVPGFCFTIDQLCDFGFFFGHYVRR